MKLKKFDVSICSFYYPTEIILSQTFSIPEITFTNEFLPSWLFKHMNSLPAQINLSAPKEGIRARLSTLLNGLYATPQIMGVLKGQAETYKLAGKYSDVFDSFSFG